MVPVVCIVDDEPDMTDMMSHLLRTKGYEVFTAGSVAEAVSVFRDNPGRITTLITDFNLGRGQNASDLLAALGSDKPGNVVLLSGQDFRNAKEEVPGVDHHLMKPLRFGKLFDAIK